MFAAVLPKRGSIFGRRNVHKGLVVRATTTLCNRLLQRDGPHWNIQSHSINRREKRNKEQENVKTSGFLLTPLLQIQRERETDIYKE